MKRTFILLALVLLLGGGLWLALGPGSGKTAPPLVTSAPAPVAQNAVGASVSVSSAAQTSDKSALLGETLLAGYASSNLPPQNDLALMSRLMDNALLLLKSAANQPLGANEDWAALFRGQNAARERFLPDSSVALNARGQLIDRWGTPLFFHALGGGRYEVRSAGSDGRLWTGDDIHRNPDGSFRRGAELNPASLMPEKR